VAIPKFDSRHTRYRNIVRNQRAASGAVWQPVDAVLPCLKRLQIDRQYRMPQYCIPFERRPGGDLRRRQVDRQRSRGRQRASRKHWMTVSQSFNRHGRRAVLAQPSRQAAPAANVFRAEERPQPEDLADWFHHQP
jgi:hypothetical protein